MEENEMIVNREDAEATAIRECRRHFLFAAARHPKIKLGDSLRRKVYDPAVKRWAELGLPPTLLPSTDWTPQQHEALEVLNDELTSLIAMWAPEHNLDHEWVREAAMEEIYMDSFVTQPFDVSVYIHGYQPPEFIWTAWYFKHEDEKQYRRRIDRSFQRKLTDYIAEVNQKRSQFLSDSKSQEAHYRWSVEKVCLRRGWNEIAKKDPSGFSYQAVAKAVKPILARIGLPQHNLSHPKI